VCQQCDGTKGKGFHSRGRLCYTGFHSRGRLCYTGNDSIALALDLALALGRA